MRIGEAVEALLAGKKVARSGWNGKGMFLVYVPGTPDVVLREGTAYFEAGMRAVTIAPHVDMFTAQGVMQPGWLCSQNDLLAQDWEIV